MKKNHHPNIRIIPKPLRLAFFMIGVLSAFCFRSIIIFKHFIPEIVNLIWYIGVTGYIFFFSYRYYIAVKRKKAITDTQLMDKISNGENLSKDDKDVLLYLLKSLKKSPERFNYLIIFILSVIAIGTDIIINIVK